MKIQTYVQNSLLLAIGASYDVIWRDLNLRLKKENCNLFQAIILTSLFFEESDLVTPSRLAEIFHTTRGNISHCLSHLEKRGWIKRRLDEKDARSYRLTLKPEGKKAATRLIKIIDQVEGIFENEFGKQSLKELIGGIRRIEGCYRNRARTVE